MAIKQIQKSIQIQAPATKVWEILFTDAFYRVWAAEFQPGSYFETDWAEGSKVYFKGDTGGGLIGHISSNLPNEYLEITYDGLLGENGVEDFDSEDAKVFKNSTESYKLTEENGQATLDINSGMDEQYYDDMAEAWDRALLKIKQMSEV
ncbi:MAG: SRPBCC domain-containing protein [Patescibacteria group bacterium]